MGTLTDKQARDLAEYRADVNDRDLAHMLAADAAMRAVQEAVEHITRMDFGRAKDVLVELIENGLPNDHNGPVTHYPLFESALAEQRARRGVSA